MSMMSEKPQGKIPVTSLHRDSSFTAKVEGVGFNSLGKVVTLPLGPGGSR